MASVAFRKAMYKENAAEALESDRAAFVRFARRYR
jgi:hypothetical protein